MNCAKCGGFMQYEKIQDYARGVWFWGWHCVFCGTIIDPLITQNKEVRPAPHKERQRVAYKRRGRKKALA